MINLLSNLNHRDQDNLCKVLQCNKEELSRLFKQAEKLYSKKYSLYEIYMKVLQQGFNVREAQRIIRELNTINFIGADVVEVSPPFDVNNMTSLVAATIAFEILCTMTRVN